MKLPFYSAIGLCLLFVSCKSTDPEYEAYKAQREAAQGAAGTAPYGPNADPYGNAAANPYGVPGGSGSEVGSYTPGPSAPYQPLPSVDPSADPIPSAPNAPGATFPPPTAPSVPSGQTSPHVVAKGDSLWGLAQRYGTTVEAIKAANGMTGDKIMSGTTIQIPRN